MKKVIAKVEYDTESATLLKKYTEGFYGDPAGFEESLYETQGRKQRENVAKDLSRTTSIKFSGNCI